MPLMKASIAQQLESVFQRKPSSASEAATDWANAYLGYASAALSAAGSLPVTATVNLGVLQSAFTSAFQAKAPMVAAAVMAQGVTGFWATMVWAGPIAMGTTTSPGNFTLASALGVIFGNVMEQSNADKARLFADAFDVGAKLVVVSDIPLIQPAPPIIGPIS